jgi:hypothetical protein
LTRAMSKTLQTQERRTDRMYVHKLLTAKEVNHAKTRKEKSFEPDGSPKAGGNNVKQRSNDDA